MCGARTPKPGSRGAHPSTITCFLEHDDAPSIGHKGLVAQLRHGWRPVPNLPVHVKNGVRADVLQLVVQAVRWPHCHGHGHGHGRGQTGPGEAHVSPLWQWRAVTESAQMPCVQRVNG